MAEQNDVAMPCKLFLERVARQLHYEKPTYKKNPDDPRQMIVRVKSADRDELTFHGHPADNVSVARELAARAAIAGLVESHRVFVEDVTAILREIDGRLAGYYERMRLALIDEVNGRRRVYRSDDIYNTRHLFNHVISIDFKLILSLMVKRVGVEATSIDTLMVRTGTFASTLSLTHPTNPPSQKPFFSGNWVSREASRQFVARQAVFYMLDMYNFRVFDINYNPALSVSCKQFCEGRKRAYLAVKELHEDMFAAPNPYLHPRRMRTPDVMGHVDLERPSRPNPIRPIPIRATTEPLLGLSIGSSRGEASTSGSISHAGTLNRPLPPKKRKIGGADDEPSDSETPGPNTDLCLASVVDTPSTDGLTSS